VQRMPETRKSQKLALIALPAILLPFVIRTAVVEGGRHPANPKCSTIGIVYARC